MKTAAKAKVGVYSCPIDISQTETKGTVLLHNAKEMLAFSKGEEEQLEKIIKEIHDSGIRVVIAGQSVGELALHTLRVEVMDIGRQRETLELKNERLVSHEEEGLEKNEVIVNLLLLLPAFSHVFLCCKIGILFRS